VLPRIPLAVNIVFHVNLHEDQLEVFLIQKAATIHKIDHTVLPTTSR